MTLVTNIDWWQLIIQKPTSEFEEFFAAESRFLLKNVTQSDKVLDLGCGDGKNIGLIVKKAGLVVGVDNDPVAVRDAKYKFMELVNVDIVCQDVSYLHLQLNSFDVVTHLILLPNLGDKKLSSLIEATKVLKKGGKLLLSTYAETALEVRVAIYEAIKAPISDVDGKSGKITFKLSTGEVISEQFSLEQLEELGREAGLTMLEHQKVGDLAYLVVFQK